MQWFSKISSFKLSVAACAVGLGLIAPADFRMGVLASNENALSEMDVGAPASKEAEKMKPSQVEALSEEPSSESLGATADPVKTKANDIKEKAAKVKDSAVELWNSVGRKAEPVEEVIEDTGEQITIEEIAEPTVDYHYASFGKPNPFVFPYQLISKTELTSYEIPIVSPLQVELSKMRVTGIWQLDNGSRRALILVPKAKSSTPSVGIIASVGDPAGLAGKITDITENAVLTRQYKILADGSREYDDIALPLYDGAADDSDHKKYVEIAPGKPPILKTEAEPDPTIVLQPGQPNDGMQISQPAAPGAPPATGIQLELLQLDKAAKERKNE